MAVLALCGIAGCRGESRTAAPPPTPTPTATPTATATPAPLTDAQRRFADAFIAAANAKDDKAMRKLILPESLACYDKSTEPYLDEWVKRRLRYTIPPDNQVRFLPARRGDRRSRYLKLPARPTEVMLIEFHTAEGKNIRMSRLVRLDNGAYHLVAPCFTGKAAAHFKRAQEKREAALRKAREIYPTLKDPLRSQLVTLIKKGKEHDAIERCMEDLKLDRRTAAAVVEILAGRASP